MKKTGYDLETPLVVLSETLKPDQDTKQLRCTCLTLTGLEGHTCPTIVTLWWHHCDIIYSVMNLVVQNKLLHCGQGGMSS